MKPFVAIFFLILCSGSVNAQTANNANAQTEKEQAEQFQIRNYSVLTLDLSTFQIAIRVQVKDELSSYDGKVVAVALNEISGILQITFNTNLRKEDLMQILSKYGINESHIIQ